MFNKPKSFSLGSKSDVDSTMSDTDTVTSNCNALTGSPTSDDSAVETQFSELSASDRGETESPTSQTMDRSLHIISDESDKTMDGSHRDATATTTNNICPMWSQVFATPSTSPAFTPSSDMSSLKQNLHGLALKLSTDRAKILSRTGKNCATLLMDIATLHDELTHSIKKQCPSTLQHAASGTPMEEFANNVNACVMSFTKQTQSFGVGIRNEVAKPWLDNSANLGDVVPKIYSEYVASRSKCAQARKDALKMRQKYVGSVKDAEGAIQSLRKARVSKHSMNSSDLSNPASPQRVDSSASSQDGGGEEDMEWENALRDFGIRHGLTKNCETVICAFEEIQTSEEQYCSLVDLENAAVLDAQTMELNALDAVQKVEEERMLFLMESLDRFLRSEQTALDGMHLELALVPLDLSSGSNHKELPVPSSAPSIFMSPRKRTQSEDGPAIAETRLLNLPDNLAELRDNMKSLVGRQATRLKTLKLVSAYNDGVASAIETFAAGLQSRLENEGYGGKT